MAPPARTPEPEFDLFVSYAHSDDRGENSGKVAAIVDAIKAEYARTIGAPLSVFFDTEAILAMDDWEARILTGLRQSKMMVAVLSPAYFASEYCRKEWEIYVETELAHALPGEGIKPIYAIKHPAFEADPVEERIRNWIKDLRRRQYIEWLPFWPEGAQALEREDVRRKLAGLPGQIAERLKRKAIRDGSSNTVPLPSVHFAGRRDEMHELLTGLIQGHIGAITAVHGIPGIGKSMLAFAYAWGLWLQVSRRPVLDPGRRPERPGRRHDRAGRAQGSGALRPRAAEPRAWRWPRSRRRSRPGRRP